MDWVLRSPQIHSTFGSLGFSHPDGYHINENCNAALETILQNILNEDKYLRSYRRSISFGQNINKDLIPLLLHAKEHKTIENLIRILVNLTIPVECLLSIDLISKTDFGRHTMFEMNNLLTSTKSAFTDHRATKVIIDFLKKNLEGELKGKLTDDQCSNINNTLLLLRNILHIPEETAGFSSSCNSGSLHTVQNQILWNIFSQSIDKILIKLMTIPDATNWGVTMVQLIALLYKDQHVVTLHKLLNLWLEASLSESSEDNESNTSPPGRGSEDSSPMLTSDPTSDSSDTGGSGKSNDDPNSVKNEWSENNNGNEPPSEGVHSFDGSQNSEKEEKSEENPETLDNKDIEMKAEFDNNVQTSSNNVQDDNKEKQPSKSEKKATNMSENSDCGYGTQIENQESISTSSNEDEVPQKKPVHQKPHNPKQRANNNKGRVNVSIQDRKRKKIVRRGKSNIINVQGLSHKTPTDDDISNILKEFTVDFLLKGYNALVQTLHTQILSNPELEIDTSHFFWLVTYFLKFATQIELDLEHVGSVLSFDIVSYLTAEGVNLCEQFQLAVKLGGNDIKPNLRRLHLVVTAIREFVQAIDMYKKFTHVCSNDKDALVRLQIKMCESDELKSLLVLLLRHYNPKYHTKQYLQDLVVTNHMLLIFLDNVVKLPDYKGPNNIVDHLKQFATPNIMNQYGILLEDYPGNGEFVNDCIFTMMHHVGGELDSLITLFQPKILKTFTSIWKSEFEICDDWSDLIQYVINTFVKKPHTLHSPTTIRLGTKNFDDEKIFGNSSAAIILDETKTEENEPAEKKQGSSRNSSSSDRWTEDEISSLNWNYMQSSSSSDVLAEIIKLFKEDGVIKTRDSVLKELYKQNLINKEEFESALKSEGKEVPKTQTNKESGRDDEIEKLCEQLSQDGKSNFLLWVQKVLLETCFAKIYYEKAMAACATVEEDEIKIMNFELFKEKELNLPVPSSVSYHSLHYRQSVPLVPWNCEQATTCKDLRFLQLLHKLGFQMPVDTGKVFIRIPYFWTTEQLFEMAGKISPIDITTLKFTLNDLSGSSNYPTSIPRESQLYAKDAILIAGPNNFYQIQKQQHLGKMINFTPKPSPSYHCEGGDRITQNWLDVIQKSQKRKLPYNLGSAMLSAETGMDIRCTDGEVPPLIVPPGIAEVVSSIMTIIEEKSESPFNVPIQDSEYYNNSICETASVASDLTRMYVSDEEDKPEFIVPAPVINLKPHCMAHEDDMHVDDIEDNVADSDGSVEQKRPRVHESML